MIHEQKADAIVMLTRLVETVGQGMFIEASLSVDQEDINVSI